MLITHFDKDQSTVSDGANTYTIPNKYRTYQTASLKVKGIKVRNTGLTIYRQSSYIVLDTTRIIVYSDGYMKAKGIYKKNYYSDKYYTEYFDHQGNEVKGKKEWDKLRAETQKATLQHVIP